MPEGEKSLVKVINEVLKAKLTDQYCFTLPTAALHIFDIKLQDFSVITTVSRRGIQLQAQANILLVYVEAQTKALKLIKQDWMSRLFVSRPSGGIQESCNARLVRGSNIHVVLQSQTSLLLDAQLHFHVTCYVERPLSVDEPVSAIHLQVTPDQTHVIPSIGTIQLEID